MRVFSLSVFFLFLVFATQAQETFLRNNFTVRDFFIKNDSVFFIEKRDVNYYNYSIDNSPIQSYFIGGYGLEIYDDFQNNEIISVSNEFTKTVSSIRFYDKASKKVEEVYYYHKGKSIDVLILPELKHVVLSLNNNKIIIINYTNKPTFKVVHEIELNAMSRRLAYEKGNLFFVTDLGEIYKYNLETKVNALLFSCGKRITDFSLFNSFIVYSTDDGEIVKLNILEGSTKKIDISDNFVLNSLQFNIDTLICGTFKGAIIIIDINNMTILDSLNYHKRSVIKILNSKENEFYSSSIDNTIKKWKIDY